MDFSKIKNTSTAVLNTTVKSTKDFVRDAAFGYMVGFTFSALSNSPNNILRSGHDTGVLCSTFLSVFSLSETLVSKASRKILWGSKQPSNEFNNVITNLFSTAMATGLSVYAMSKFDSQPLSEFTKSVGLPLFMSSFPLAKTFLQTVNN